MRRARFRELLRKRVCLLDGATGTELIKMGLPPGAPPEKWVLENPGVIRSLHRAYSEAGSDFVLACTFGANRPKLAIHGLEHELADMNRRLVEISRQAVPDDRFVLGDLSPTGELVEPNGPLPFEEAVSIYREQAAALVRGGADGLMIETMLDIQEARAALLGAREAAPDLPILVGMTYEKTGRTLGGSPPEAVVVVLQSLGADAVGCNCSSGPEEMLALVERMLPLARVPLFMKPNAGMPRLVDGRNVYSLPPDRFAREALRGVSAGLALLGGCCGTSSAHIRELRKGLDRLGDPVPPPPAGRGAVLASSRKVVDFSDRDGVPPPLVLIGERINPTGKKAFQAELLAGDFGRVADFAGQQVEAGADVLDVNLGLGGIDETAAMRTAVSMLAPACDAPLAIDSVEATAMEAGLRLYPGRALANSVSGEKRRLESILPLVGKYGAMAIILPVGEGFIPTTAGERLQVAEGIFAEAEKLGMNRNDLLIDGLAMAVSADPSAGSATLEFLSLCAARGFRTVVGLSNISFGMPGRKWLNSAFLAMAMAHGLSAAIANPSAEGLGEARLSAGVLSGRHAASAAYIERFGKHSAAPGPSTAANPADGKTTTTDGSESPSGLAAKAILRGDIKRAAALVRQAVESGVPAGKLVSESLAPAIVKAGDMFERNEYYLPQLMLAGEAMRLALAELEPDLARAGEAGNGGTAARGRVIMATVNGDVHDIGKNLVCLMLRNRGFEVFDLGKNVQASAIVSAAQERRADIVGLSALMTTTLAAMRETIGAIRDASLPVKVMVGGAAVTRHFAAEVGADGYSADAASAARLAGELLEKGK